MLLALTRVNDEGRNTRKRISREDAIYAAEKGDDKLGEQVLRMLSGERSWIKTGKILTHDDKEKCVDKDGKLLTHEDIRMIADRVLKAVCLEKKMLPIRANWVLSVSIGIFSARCLTVMALSELPAGYGLLVEAGDGLMAQVSPVRTWQHRVGRILKPSAAWMRSRGAHLFQRRDCLIQPPSNLPISATWALTWAYCPSLSQCH